MTKLENRAIVNLTDYSLMTGLDPDELRKSHSPAIQHSGRGAIVHLDQLENFSPGVVGHILGVNRGEILAFAELKKMGKPKSSPPAQRNFSRRDVVMIDSLVHPEPR